MNIDKTVIFSECRYDVDNRYVDMSIHSVYDGQAFVLILADTSNIENTDSEIELYLTRENLKLVIDRLTGVLDNERSSSETC